MTDKNASGQMHYAWDKFLIHSFLSPGERVYLKYEVSGL
jgi:hypothetical protein